MAQKNKNGMEIEGYKLEGISIAGHETCIIIPSLSIVFDIGVCPRRAVSQDFLFISHAHMDHIGGLPKYVATRELLSMKPPTIFVPSSIKEHVERLFEVHRAMDFSELKHNLISLDVGEEVFIRKDTKVKAFKTYHVIPSQGYVVYSIKQKLKEEYAGLPSKEIRELKLSGVEVTNTVTSTEIAFTGDTKSDFIVDSANADVLRAKILVMECTYIDIDNQAPARENGLTHVSDKQAAVDHAREYGHTHISEVVEHADMFQNKAILFIHFSARYKANEIKALSKLPKTLSSRVYALTEGF